MKSIGRTLYLIPWHIGARGDMTLNAVHLARRLRCFLAEDADEAKSQFFKVLRLDCAGKEFHTIPPRPEPGFLNRAVKLLAREDVGLVSSGGVPCFADPGGWLVRELRARGAAIAPMAGASSLTTLLSLSGFDWLEDPPTRSFSFTFFEVEGPHENFRDAAGRRREPVIVFLRAKAFPKCLEIMEDLAGQRPISVFFDLTKPRHLFPYADRVETRSLAEWRESLADFDWRKVSDIALMLHPEATRR